MTLPEGWKIRGTWKWRLYHLLVERLERWEKAEEETGETEDYGNRNDQLDFLKRWYIPTETCCHLEFTETNTIKFNGKKIKMTKNDCVF